MEYERRYLAIADIGDDALGLEERADGPVRIRGIAPPWNSWSHDLGGFRERFMPGAFRKFLDRSPTDPRGKADVIAAWNHDESRILGRTTNGTLELRETERGLEYSATPPEGTATTTEVLTLIRGKYIFGSSFAFTVANPQGETFDTDPSGKITRTITEAALYDVSPVARAAYPSSTLGLRSLEKWKAENLTATENARLAEEAADLQADRVRSLAGAKAAAAAAVARMRAHAG
jgi:HK97 family phage prohead protease